MSSHMPCHFSGILHNFVFIVNLVTSNIRVRMVSNIFTSLCFGLNPHAADG